MSAVKDTLAYLHETYYQLLDTVERVYGATSWDRDDFSREVTMRTPEYSWAMFTLLDGEDIEPRVRSGKWAGM